MNKVSIKTTVQRRVDEYDENKEHWYKDYFLPTMEQIKFEILSWEDIINTIETKDVKFGSKVIDFYERCLRFNGITCIL